jgi:hypothetical protein
MGCFSFITIFSDSYNKMKTRIFLLMAILGMTGCLGTVEKSELNVPASSASYLKSYNRYIFPSHSSFWKSTGITVDKGDMVLLFGSGLENFKYTFASNFQVKIGNGAETNPFASYNKSYDYGYLMAGRNGILKCRTRAKTAGSYVIDIITFSEKHEDKLFSILDEIKAYNSDNETLRSQIDGFKSDYNWISYTEVEIQSSPKSAKIYFDGNYVGLTPLKLYNVEKHTEHKLCVRLDPYQEICETFQAGKKSRFNLLLKKGPDSGTTSVSRDQDTISSDKAPPSISIENPKLSPGLEKVVASDFTINISGTVQDENGVVWVKVNGEYADLDPDGYFRSYQNLAVGINRFVIEAKDTKNNIAADQILVERTPIRADKSKTELHKAYKDISRDLLGDFYLLAIGNNAYRHFPELKTAVNDARKVAEVCKKLYGFKVKLIINGTRHKILSTLDSYRRELEADDNLLIYYAGHGYLDKDINRGYWLPVEAMEHTSADWISNADITDKLRAIKAKHIMIIADSCYSGTLTRGLTVSDRSRDYLTRISQKKCRTVLTSGGLEPVTDSQGGDHSVFAKTFLETLMENQGTLDGTELFGLIRRPVMLNSRQTPRYSDIRFAGHEGGDFLFVRIK